MRERLQKILSRYGVASRRAAEAMLADGRVCVNGAAAQLGSSADAETDEITVDGKPLRDKPEAVCLLLNKPRGYVTTMRDERGRKSVAELVADCPARVYPIGRLDQYSEGLLLFTNDGELANRLSHPSAETEKTYLVWVSGYTAGAEAQLAAPIAIDGRLTAPAQVRLRSADGNLALLELTLHEGRNRQIRRLCKRAGLTVTRLKRIREGAISLGDLPVGKWRYLTEDELASLG